MVGTPFWEPVLTGWDVQAEQDKADFMEFLYDYYKPETHHFTGLWERFKEESAQHIRNMMCTEEFKHFMDPGSVPDVES